MTSLPSNQTLRIFKLPVLSGSWEFESFYRFAAQYRKPVSLLNFWFIGWWLQYWSQLLFYVTRIRNFASYFLGQVFGNNVVFNDGPAIKPLTSSTSTNGQQQIMGILQRESPQYNNRSIVEANFSELGPCAKEKCCRTTNFPLEHWSISISTFTSTCSSLLASYSSSWSSVVSHVSCHKGDWSV